MVSRRFNGEFNVYDGTRGLQKEAAVFHIKASLDSGIEDNHSFEIANCRIRCIYAIS